MRRQINQLWRQLRRRSRRNPKYNRIALMEALEPRLVLSNASSPNADQFFGNGSSASSVDSKSHFEHLANGRHGPAINMDGLFSRTELNLHGVLGPELLRGPKGGEDSPVITVLRELQDSHGRSLFVRGTFNPKTGHAERTAIELFAIDASSSRPLGVTLTRRNGSFQTVLRSELLPNEMVVARGDLSGRGFSDLSLPVGLTPAVDHDADGIDSELEALAVNDGDGNEDGIADADQRSVITFPALSNGEFITVDGKGRGLTNLHSNRTDVIDNPLSERLPLGLVSFEIHEVELGSIVEIEMIMSEGFGSPGYLKQDPVSGELTPFDFDGQTGALIDGNRVRLYLQDGGRGDADGVANGIILDPGGPLSPPRLGTTEFGAVYLQECPTSLVGVNFGIRWGDGTSDDGFSCSLNPLTNLPQFIDLVGGGAIEFIEHRYADDMPTSTGVDKYVITTKDTATTLTLAEAFVTNVAPEIEDAWIVENCPFDENFADANRLMVYEGSEIQHAVSWIEPSTYDSFVQDFYYGDGTVGHQSGYAQQFPASHGIRYIAYQNHTYVDDIHRGTPQDAMPFQVTVKDDDGGMTEIISTVVVVNVPPVIESVTISPNYWAPYTTFGIVITDRGLIDDDFLSIDWGDGSPIEAIYLGPSGVLSRSVYGNHWFPDAGTYEVTIVATDDDLGQDTWSQTVTIVEDCPDTGAPPDPHCYTQSSGGIGVNDPPQLPEAGPFTAYEDQWNQFMVAGSDPNGDELRYSVVGPPGLYVGLYEGGLHWKPLENQSPGSFQATVTVFDDAGSPLGSTIHETLTASKTYNITAAEVNRQATLQVIANQTVVVGDTMIVNAEAIDFDSPTNELTYSATGLSGLQVDSQTGEIRWTPELTLDPGDYWITYSVTDNGLPPLTDTKQFRVTVTVPSTGTGLTYCDFWDGKDRLELFRSYEAATDQYNFLDRVVVNPSWRCHSRDIPAIYGVPYAPVVISAAQQKVLFLAFPEGTNLNLFNLSNCGELGLPDNCAQVAPEPIENLILGASQDASPELYAIAQAQYGRTAPPSSPWTYSFPRYFILDTAAKTFVDDSDRVYEYPFGAIPYQSWTQVQHTGFLTDHNGRYLQLFGAVAPTSCDSADQLVTLRYHRPEDFSYNINWGDGTNTTGTLNPTEPDGGIPQTTHTYAEFGDYPITVDLWNPEYGGGAGDASHPSVSLPADVSTWPDTTAGLFGSYAEQMSRFAKVSDSWIDINPSPTTIVPEQLETDFSLGVLDDYDPLSSTYDYEVVINWGDGTQSSGSLIPNSEPSGGYYIHGSHSYLYPGINTVNILVAAEDNSQATANKTIISGRVFNISNVSVSESSAYATFTIALSSVATSYTSVAYNTLPLAAFAGDDYQAVGGTVTFTQGEIAKYVEVPIIDDSINEGTETFLLSLFDPVGAILLDGPGGNHASATIIDNDPNQAPVLQPIPDFVIDEDGLFSFTASASDPDEPQQTLSYALTQGQSIAGVQLDAATGQFHWTPSEAQGPAEYSFTITASDDGFPSLSHSRMFKIFVQEVNISPNQAPRFTSIPSVDANVDHLYEYFPIAIDPENDIPLTYFLESGPVGLAMSDSATGRVSWTPASTYVGKRVPVTLGVIDAKGAEQKQLYEILVSPDPENHPPVIVSVPVETHQINAAVGTATGNVSPSLIELNLAAGETATQKIGAVVSTRDPAFIPPQGPADAFTIQTEFSANKLRDALLGGGSPGINVNAVSLNGKSDLAPVIGSIPSQTLEPGWQIEVPFNAFDPEDEHLEFTFSGGTTDVSINFAGTPSAPTITIAAEDTAEAVGYYVVSVSATDEQELGREQTSTTSFLVTVGSPEGPPPELGDSSSTDPIASTGIFVNNSKIWGMTDYGIVLSTGNAADYGTAENHLSENRTTKWELTQPINHPLLEPITSLPSNDVTEMTIQFDLMEGFDTISFEVVFGSEEFPEWVSTFFNDGFGLYINGENIAFAPGDNGSPLTINIDHPEMRYQNGCRIINNANECDPNGPGTGRTRLVGTLLDGVLAPNGRPVLKFTKYLGDGRQNNELSFVIGDSGDNLLDTTAYIGKLSAWSETPREIDLVASSPDAAVRNVSGPVSAMPVDKVVFDAEFTGTGVGQVFDLNVIDVKSGYLLGSVPVSINNSYFYLAKAIDDDGDALTWSLRQGPNGATINSATGQIQWLPPATGEYAFLVHVEDGHGGSDEQAFQVSVHLPSPNAPPEFNSTPVEEAIVGTGYTYELAATDPDGDSVGFFLVDGPSGMSVDNRSHLLTWLPHRSVLGQSYPVHVRATDGRGGVDDQTFSVTVVPNPNNSAPQFVSDPIEQHAIAPLLNPIGSVWPTKLQLDLPPDLVLHEDVTLDIINRDITVDLPPGRPDEMVVYDEQDPIKLQKMLTLGGASGIQVTAVNFSGQRNDSPVLAHIPDQQIDPGQTLSFQLSATDANQDDIIYLLDSNSGARGVTLNRLTGLLEWTPTESQANRQHIIIVAAMDARGEFVSQKFVVTVGAAVGPPPRVDPQYPLVGPHSSVSTGVYVNRDGSFGLGRYGIVLSTGNATAYGTGESKSGNTSTYYGSWATPEQDGLLDSISGKDMVYQDVTELNIDFNVAAGVNTIQFEVVFGSEEFREYVGDAFGDYGGDTFGILVNGQNIAFAEAQVVDSSGQPVTQMLPINIDHLGMKTSIESELDGVLVEGNQVVLTVSASLVAGSTDNHLKIILADAMDGMLDTTVYISNLGGFRSQQFEIVPTASSPSIAMSSDPISTIARPSESVSFTTQFVGTDGTPASFHLQFLDEATGNLLGAIPVTVNNTYFYFSRAADPDGDMLTYSIVQAPDGATIDRKSGLIRWEPPAIGEYNFVIRVSDAAGAFDEQSFTVTVSSVNGSNTAPVITSQPNTAATVAENYSYQVAATDNDGDALQYYLSNPPARMTIERHTGKITWLPGPEFDGQTVEVVVHVFDRRGGTDQQTFQIAVSSLPISVNHAPRFVSIPIEHAYVGDRYVYTARATDEDGDELTYKLIVAPPGMAIDSTSGRIGWKPRREDMESQSVLIRVSDGKGGADTQAFDISVFGTNDPPKITSDPRKVPALQHKEWLYPLTADDPNGDAVKFILDEAPAGMTLDANNVVHWLPEEGGTYQVSITATDGRGGNDTQAFSLPVNLNNPPQILSSAPQYAGVNKPFRYTIVAVDADRDPLAYSFVTAAADLPPGLQITGNAISGWTPQPADLDDTFSFEVKVDDGRHGIVTQTITVLVVENLLDPGTPVIISRPPWPAVVDREWRYQLTAEDPDGDSVSFSIVQGPPGMKFEDAGTGQSLLSWTPTEASDGMRIEIRVTDSSPESRSSTQTFDLPVRPSESHGGNGWGENNPPEVTSEAQGPARIGYEWVYQVEAKDPEGNALDYSFISAPDGMTIDKRTGKVQWIATEEGNYKVQIWVWDGERGTSHGFTLPVTATNHPPRIYGIPYDPLYVGYQWRYELMAYDPDGDELTWLIEDKRPLPRRQASPITEVVENGRRFIQWTPLAGTSQGDPGDVGSYGSGNELLWITVKDGRGGEWTEKMGIGGPADPNSPTFDVRTLSQAHTEPYGPVVVTLPSAPPVVGELWTYTVAAVDPDGVHNSFRVERIELKNGTEILASSYNSDTIQFTADPTRWGLELKLEALVHELDANGNIAQRDMGNGQMANESTAFIIEPIRVIGRNRAPVITSTPLGQAQFEPDPSHPGSVRPVWTYEITATDADPADELNFWVDPFPFITQNGQQETPNTNPDFQISNVYASNSVWHATLTWRPANTTVKSQPVVIRVSDGKFPNPGIQQPDVSYWSTKRLASFDEQFFTITVPGGDTTDVNAPVITSLPDITALVNQITAEEIYSYRITAIDPNDANGTFTFAATSPTTEVRNALQLVPAQDNKSAELRWNPKETGNDTIIITVTDSSGLKTTQTFLASAIESYSLNEPPTIVSTPPDPAARDLEYRYQIIVNDPNKNDDFYYRLVKAPSGVAINDDGLLTWVPAKAGTYEIVLKVWDRDPADEDVQNEYKLHSDEQRFDLRVLQNAPPQLKKQVSKQTAFVGQDLTVNFQQKTEAYDPNAGDTLTYVLDKAPLGATVNSTTGVIQWTPISAQPQSDGGELGRHPFIVTVEDNHGASSTQTFDVQVLVRDASGNVIDHPPEITSQLRTSVAADRRYLHQVIARDADGDDLHYELVLPSDNTKPAGMTMDQTGLISWIPKMSQVRTSPYSFQVKVTSSRDGVPTSEAADIENYDIRVTRELENSEPSIVSRPKRSATVDYLYVYDPLATDPDHDPVSWKLDQSPPGMTVDAETGRVNWKPATNQIGDHTVELQATDLYGKSAVQKFTVITRGANLPPQIDSFAPNLAAIGEQYLYQVTAHDPDDGDLIYSVTSVVGTAGSATAPGNMVIHPRTGLLTWTPQASHVGDHKLRVTLTDDRGATSSEIFTLSVYDPAVNRPPVIDSPPPHPVAIVAKAGESPIAYSYAFHAVDNDNNGRSIRYGKLSGPGTIDASTGLYTWTPTAAGQQRVTLTVTDDALTVKQTFLLTARENALPTLEEIAALTFTRGQTLRVDLKAADADGDRLKYQLLNAPEGMTVDTRGVVLWKTPTNLDLGTNSDGSPATSKTVTLTALALDLFGETDTTLERADYSSHAERTFSVTIKKDSEAPEIKSMQFEKSSVTVGETAVVLVDATDNVGIVSLTLTAIAPNNVNKNIDLDFRGKGKLILDQLGTWTFSAIAVDAEGNVTSPPTTATIVAEPDRHPPVVVFNAPRDGASITEPIEVIGTVDDKESNSGQYTLTANRSDGSGRTIVLATGGEVKDAVLGTFDPTMLDNGMYDLTLSAQDADGNPSSKTIQVHIEGNLKPGAFSLQFTDLQIPGLGMPITVSRSYSTTRADRNLDFGYGWQMDFGKPDRDVDYAEGTTSGLGGQRPLLENSRVDITLLDGSVEHFKFKPIPGEFNMAGQATFYVPYFEQDRGNTSYLFVDDVKLLKIESGNGNHEYIDMYTGQSYNPAGSLFGGAYKVAMHDGIVYGIDAKADNFAWLEDRNKNKVTFTDSGISSSNGRSVQFVRTCNGEECPITKVIVPDETPSNPNDNPYIEYHYDVAGNLTGVTDLARATTDFVYTTSGSAATDPFQSHLITQVVDALNRVTASNQYDQATGRLTQLTDAAGNITVNDYSVGTRSQTITSPDGGTTKIYYDRRGNVTTQTVTTGTTSNDPPLVTVREYDGRNNLIKEIEVLGALDGTGNSESNDIVTQYTYDSFRAPITNTNARGNRSKLAYDKHGSVVSATDPLGSTTRYIYDNRGNLVEAVDPSKVKTTFSYDLHGSMQSATNHDQQTLVTNIYDSFGQVTKSTSATGQSTYFRYDALGRTTHTWRVETVSGVKTKFVDFTDYNPASRVEGTKHFELVVTGGAADDTIPDLATLTPLWQTATSYNAIGQVTSTSDRSGLTTTTLFDKRGLSIQTRTESLPSGATAGSSGSAWLVSRTVYDSHGRAILTTDPFLESTASGEVGTGNPAAGITVTGSRTIYDQAGRVVKYERVTNVAVTISGSTDQTRVATYNDSGANAVQVISNSTTTYDGLGRTDSSVDDFGLKSISRYNKFGELIETRRQVPPSAILPSGATAGSSSSAPWLTTRTVYNSKGQTVFSSDQFLLTVSQQGVETIATEDGKLLGTVTKYDDQGRVIKTQRVKAAEVTINETGDTVLTKPGTVLFTSETVYNAKGQVAKTIAADGQTTENEYDLLGRQVATIGPPVPADSVELPPGILNTIPDPHSTKVRLRTETAYRTDGKVDRQIDNVIVIQKPDGTTVTNRNYRQEAVFQYDAQGNQITTTRNGYDGGTSFAISVSTSAEFDSNGRKVAETDEMSLTKNFEYDTEGRLTAVVLPAVPDPQDLDPATGQPKLKRPRYEYGYDAQGNQTLIRDALGHETTFGFDDRGRQLWRKLPLNVESTKERFTYDSRGRQKLHIDFEGNVTEFVYDDGTPAADNAPAVPGSGRLLEKRFYANFSDQLAGNPPAEVTSYKYDSFGRQVEIKQTAATEIRTTTNAYNNAGQVVLIKSAEGVINYGYDSLGRKIRTYTTGGPGVADSEVVNDTTYGYDALGRLATVSMVERNNVSVEANQRDTRYSYDLRGNLELERLPNGVVTDYVFDTLSRLDKLTHFGKDDSPTNLSNNPKLAEFDYTVRADGKRTRSMDTFWLDGTPQTSTFDWTYDGVGRLIEESLDVPAGSSPGSVGENSRPFADYRDIYQFDLVGNRLRKSTWNSLASNPLTQPADATTSYSYDANDRLLEETIDLLTGQDTQTTYFWGTRADANSPWSATSQTGKQVFDLVSSSPILRESTSYTYNLQGRLSHAVIETFADSQLIRRSTSGFRYGDDGIRVSATHKIEQDNNGSPETLDIVTDTKTTYLNDPLNFTGYSQVLLEILVSDLQPNAGQVIKSHIYTHGRDVVAQTMIDSVAGVGERTFFLLYDGHGSTRVLADISGQIALAHIPNVAGDPQVYTYDGYGVALGFNPDFAGTSHQYSGEPWDFHSQMQYLDWRYLDVQTGRFNRLDPYSGDRFNPLTFHRYGYVHGDPVQGIDPSGQMSLSSMIGIAQGIAFRVASFSVTYYPIIQKVTTVTIGVSLVSLITIVLEQQGFFPETSLNDWTFLISTAIGTAGLSLQSLANQLRPVVNPLRGTTDGQLISGGEANRRIVEGSSRPGYSSSPSPYYKPTPPFKENAPIAEGRVSPDARLVRVYTEDPANPGPPATPNRWITTASEIEGRSKAEIQQRLALDKLPTHVVNVEGAAGFPARVGEAGPLNSQPGGGIQIEVLDRGYIMTNPRQLPGT